MNPRLKKILLTALIVVFLLGLIILIIYFLLFNTAVPGEEGSPSVDTAKEGDLPVSAKLPTTERAALEEAEKEKLLTPAEKEEKKQISLVIGAPIVGPVLASNNKIRFFSKKDGSPFEIDSGAENQNCDIAPPTSSCKRIVTIKYPGIISADWNDSGSAALITTANNTTSEKSWNILDIPLNVNFDVAELQDGTKDTKISNATLSRKERSYLYQYRDEIANTSVLSSADYSKEMAGIGWQNILPVGFGDLNVAWPKNDKISYYHPPTGLSESGFYVYDTTAKALKKIISSAFGFSAKWSPDGNYFLFSSTDKSGKNLQLSIGDELSNIIRINIGENMPLATIPEKCSFSPASPVFYCAAINSIPIGLIMPDDYYKGIANSNDTIYKFTLTGRPTKISALGAANLDPTGSNSGYNVEQMLISADGKYLYFLNKRDGFLYKMSLLN